MVLTSQAARRGSNRGYVSTYRQKKRRRVRRIALVVGVLLAAFLVWSFWGNDENDPGENPAPTPAPVVGGDDPAGVPDVIPPVVPGPGPVAPAPTPTPTPKPPTPTPTPTPPAPGPTNVGDPPAAPPAAAPKRTSDEVRRSIDLGRKMIANDQLLDARDLLNRALAGSISPADAIHVRTMLAEVNETLVFSPKVAAGDPYTETYVIRPNDRLSKIASRYDVPWRFIARINGDLDPNRIQVGQRIKLVRGPIHCVVHKSAFRMDLYLGDPTSPGAMFIRSLPVGTGAHGGTPTGRFIVKKHSKLINPEWVNPRTGEKFHADNPENPLGEYWIGIRGIDEETETLRGYGIHGTIEPKTIGTEASMGCVRMRDADIELVYFMLSEEQSTITILP